MTRRPCLGCGELIGAGSYCRSCRNSRRSPSSRLGRPRAARQLRAQAIAAAGRRCERCGAGPPLELHHRDGAAAGGLHELGNFEVLCRPCHVDTFRSGAIAVDSG